MNQNTYSIPAHQLQDLLSLINYYHSKIQEGSAILGESLDLISDEMISELSEFVDLETSATGRS